MSLGSDIFVDPTLVGDADRTYTCRIRRPEIRGSDTNGAPNMLNQPIRQLGELLATGGTTSRALIEAALAAIEDPAGEGSMSFIAVAADRARAEADAWDSLRAAKGWAATFGGIPIAVKDLADVAGEVTTAGSTALAAAAPASADAAAVARLRAAGFVVVGRTNMTEFAFSGLGLNPHYGTPASPWDRSTRRIPGGSSSGSAVAVADGMAPAALGTDTGGSCRIPAAFCNIVGYKPTARRVPLDGIVPLSPSLDSVGPLANTVDCAAIVDAILAGDTVPSAPADRPDGGLTPSTLRIGVLRDFVLDDLDETVAARFDAAISALSKAGVSVVEVAFPELNELGHINRDGGLAPAEALEWHRRLIAERGDRYDQRVRRRIEGGSGASAVYYIEVMNHRRRLVDRFTEVAEGFDALVAPTVAIPPPPIDSFPPDGDPSDPDDRYYSATNLKALRNTSVGNFLDACAISLPLCPPEERATTPAVGVMLMGPAMSDRRLLRTAGAVEKVLLEVG